jgi:hypothetical protein
MPQQQLSSWQGLLIKVGLGKEWSATATHSQAQDRQNANAPERFADYREYVI